MLDKSFRENGYVEELEHPIGVPQVVAAILFIVVMLTIGFTVFVLLLGFLESTTKPHTTDAPFQTPSTAPARSGDRSGGDVLPPFVPAVDTPRYTLAYCQRETPQEFFIRSLAGSSYQSAYLSCVALGSRSVPVSGM